MSYYIQAEINGKLRSFRYGNATDIEIAIRMEGIKNPVILGSVVIWAGLYIGCLVDDLPIDFSFKDVCDWTEKMKVEDIKNIHECYKQSLNFEKPESDKKKTTAKKSIIKNTKTGALK